MTPGSVAIVGGRLVPINGEPVDDGAVLVEDGKIVGVGSTVSVPAGVPVIDADGCWVLPGFIDAHAHSACTRRRRAGPGRTPTR